MQNNLDRVALLHAKALLKKGSILKRKTLIPRGAHFFNLRREHGGPLTNSRNWIRAVDIAPFYKGDNFCDLLPRHQSRSVKVYLLKGKNLLSRGASLCF